MRVPEKYDDIAPDNSEIRLLPSMNRGGICHCTLPAGKTSLATKHKTVEEIWYFLEGQGELWRKQDSNEETTKVNPGLSITIPTGTQFQFRSTSNDALCFICVTMPPWPGPEEAVKVQGTWEPSP